MTEEYKKVLRETMRAYADCWAFNHDEGVPFHESPATEMRSLSFRASRAVTRDEAISIMCAAVDEYNAFRPELLRALPAGCLVTIARESSVCVYVHCNGASVPEGLATSETGMMADEYHEQPDGSLRLWWD